MEVCCEEDLRELLVRHVYASSMLA